MKFLSMMNEMINKMKNNIKEIIVLIMYFLLFIYLNMLNYESYFSMMFLTFKVCESALGLLILVSMIRSHGNDYFKSFSIM